MRDHFSRLRLAARTCVLRPAALSNVPAFCIVSRRMEARYASAIDALLSANDPKEMSYEDFRGAQFDHGLAWVYFDEGHGGLGVNPGLQNRLRFGCVKREPRR